MPVTDQVMGAARAYLGDDLQKAAALTSRLSDADAHAYALLLQAVLSLAAGRRFAPGYNDGDVIRYVAGVRTGTDSRAEDLDLDPKAAEAVLRHALGRATLLETDAETQMRAVMALLTVVLSELSLDEPGLEALLGEAGKLADQWMS